MNNLPKVLPGYYTGRVIYNGPSGMNPIANGYTSGSMSRPFDFGEDQTRQRCAVAPKYEEVLLYYPPNAFGGEHPKRR